MFGSFLVGDLRLHWGWLSNWTWPQYWNWHKIFHSLGLNPFEWLLTPLLGGATLAVRRFRQSVKEARAAAWPSTYGSVLVARVTEGYGYWVQVEYRFFAMDEYRYGKFARHFRRKLVAESFAKVVRQLQVPVRYRLDDPNVSVLIERELQFAGSGAGSFEVR